ncbi:MAG: hypothetical protein V4704_02400 [Pseudomonadota bacterium]
MDLSKLPVEHGVRLRGEQGTRLETFVEVSRRFGRRDTAVEFASRALAAARAGS